ncbi:MAG TPA: hypothetical protein VGZ02_11460 [Candidatus Baltobacteraceae bacterium]|nr:hypothetical protein [Candidatus Baltobacteraceae bacterium]
MANSKAVGGAFREVGNMAGIQVGPDHVIGGVIHVQILKDPAKPGEQAFSAQINAPGFSDAIAISDNASKQFRLPGVTIAGAPVSPTVLVQVENFTLLPAGASASNATALSFLLVFKLVEIFRITIGSIPVTASLK